MWFCYISCLWSARGAAPPTINRFNGAFFARKSYDTVIWSKLYGYLVSQFTTGFGTRRVSLLESRYVYYVSRFWGWFYYFYQVLVFYGRCFILRKGIETNSLQQLKYHMIFRG